MDDAFYTLWWRYRMPRVSGVLVCFFCFLLVALGGGDASAETLTYQYDQAGRLVKVTSDTGYSIEYTYDSAGNVLGREVISLATGDAGSADGGGNGGCGCDVSSSGGWTSMGFILLGLVLLLGRGRRRARSTLSLLVFLGLSGYALQARAVTVCPSGCDHTTIEAAPATLWTPTQGGTVVPKPGTYNESNLVVPNKVTIRSSDPNNPKGTVVDGGGGDTVFEAASIVAFIGLTIQNGKAKPAMPGGDAFGGAISAGDSLYVSNCIIQNNHAMQGGGNS